MLALVITLGVGMVLGMGLMAALQGAKRADERWGWEQERSDQ